MGELRIRLLGGLDVDGVAPTEMGSRKARTLVKLLALRRGAPVSADTIVEALWPDDDVPAKPVEQIGVLVSRLRSVFGADRLVRTDAGWALVVDWLDVAELDDRVDEAAARLAAGQPAAARAVARAALTLVRGELLADEPDAVWGEADRAAVGRTVARARLVGAEAALAAGDAADAAAVADGALDHDPYDEAALRVLMRAHAAAGRPASALAAYARVRERLADDLGVDPVKETEELHTAILLGDLQAATAPAAPRAALVGRDRDLVELDRLLEQARSGPAVLAIVEGEAGIGKTSLVTAWSAGHPADALVLSGRCDELGRDLPLQPVLDGLDAHVRSLDADAATAVLGEAEPVLGPLLGRFGASSIGAGPTTVHDPAEGQALFFASLLAVIERAAGERPAVLVVEDVHLASASTIEFLHFAVRRGRRLLVVATRRPEGAPIGGADIVSLGPLDKASVALIVGDERADQLFERSGGHPLFLHELANAEPGALPASIRDAVAQRVDGLGDAAATLRAAAILGAEVDVDLLAGVLGTTVAVLLEHVDIGLRALLLADLGSALAFRHDLVREALLAGTTAPRRAFVHREAARVLDERPGHDPMQVAFHARAAGDVDAAAAALVDAAGTAANRYDVALATELLTDAIGLVDRVDARLARARLRVSTWDVVGAHEDVARAMELGAGPAGLEVAGWVAYYQRDYERAYEYAEEAVAQSDDDGLRTSSLAMSGRVLHASGDLHGAAARLEEAVRLAPADVRGLAHAWLGALRVHQGRLDEAAALIERALVERRWLGHPFVLHHVNMGRALALGQRGRPDDARRAVDDMRAAAIAAGQAGERFVVAADNILSWLQRGVGRFEAADEATLAALASIGADTGTLMSEPHVAALLDWFEGRVLAGDVDGGGAAAEAAADVQDRTGTMMWHHRQRHAVLRARLEMLRADPAEALALAVPVIDDSRQRGAARYGALATVVAGRARFELGDHVEHDPLDAALATLDQCCGLEAWLFTAELAASSGVDRWRRDAERRAGALIARAGDDAEALRRFVASTL